MKKKEGMRIYITMGGFSSKKLILQSLDGEVSNGAAKETCEEIWLHQTRFPGSEMVTLNAVPFTFGLLCFNVSFGDWAQMRYLTVFSQKSERFEFTTKMRAV